MNRFVIGNTSTLSIPNIREKLIDFYQKNYSSNIMQLAILSPQPIEELIKLVEKYFSGIENKNVERSNYDPLPYS